MLIKKALNHAIKKNIYIIAVKSERTSSFPVYIKVWEVCPLFQLKRCLKRRIHLYTEHLRHMKILMHSDTSCSHLTVGT